MGTRDWGRPLSAAVVLATALLSFSFPAAGQLFGGDETARKQVAEQAKRIDALSAQLTRIEDSLKGLSASNPAFELSQQIERLRTEVMQLRGQIEVLSNENQAAAKRARDMYVDLDSRLKRFEQSPPPAAGAPAGGAAAAPDKPAAGATEAETRAYEAAQQQRRIGNYPAAIAGFQTFIAQYPKSPLAHRAQYWIGDSQYNLRDFKSAIASQQKLAREIDKYRQAIAARIKRFIVEPPNVQGNPVAQLDITILPGGEVLDVRTRKSSGQPAWDNACERAIRRAQPLPLPPVESPIFKEFRELTHACRFKE